MGIALAVATTAIAASLAGCGQKGPLTLPKPSPANAPASAASAPAS
ncbi:MAG: lipoprotein [Piscinibacter sp.]|nr:lipoprotein [Piscinibacter sp.]